MLVTWKYCRYCKCLHSLQIQTSCVEQASPAGPNQNKTSADTIMMTPEASRLSAIIAGVAPHGMVTTGEVAPSGRGSGSQAPAPKRTKKNTAATSAAKKNA